jgi:predicted transcriptional regulator
MAEPREKFATQVDPSILARVRTLAQQEGRQLQALVEEALADLIEKRKNTHPRPAVMAAYHASHEKYGALYKKLAR